MIVDDCDYEWETVTTRMLATPAVVAKAIHEVCDSDWLASCAMIVMAESDDFQHQQIPALLAVLMTGTEAQAVRALRFFRERVIDALEDDIRDGVNDLLQIEADKALEARAAYYEHD